LDEPLFFLLYLIRLQASGSLWDARWACAPPFGVRDPNYPLPPLFPGWMLDLPPHRVFFSESVRQGFRAPPPRCAGSSSGITPRSWTPRGLHSRRLLGWLFIPLHSFSWLFVPGAVLPAGFFVTQLGMSFFFMSPRSAFLVLFFPDSSQIAPLPPSINGSLPHFPRFGPIGYFIVFLSQVYDPSVGPPSPSMKNFFRRFTPAHPKT